VNHYDEYNATDSDSSLMICFQMFSSYIVPGIPHPKTPNQNP